MIFLLFSGTLLVVLRSVVLGMSGSSSLQHLLWSTWYLVSRLAHSVCMSHLNVMLCCCCPHWHFQLAMCACNFAARCNAPPASHSCTLAQTVTVNSC